MKKIPIGISDFKKIIESSYYFVDKSLLIEEFIRNSADIILIPRPRRFGKTLNMSMMKYFFDINEDSSHLFKNLNINTKTDIMKLQGKYPVIFITFKDIKYNTFENTIQSFGLVLSDVYKKYTYLLDSDTLLDVEKKEFKKILNQESDSVILSRAIKNLTEYLSKYHKEKVILLIDEYDVPIQEGYLHGYYDEIIGFERNILSAALKDNNHIKKAMITGILRVAKESIFSGLNNLEVDTLLRDKFSDKFGFLENEVDDLITYYNIEEQKMDLKKWYNGYVFGNNIIYNPWSILNYAENIDEGLMPHWVNTSMNDLVNVLLAHGDEDIKKDLETLLSGNSIGKIINDNIIMSEIEDSSENIWSFLLFTGYLKCSSKKNIDGDLVCKLEIPNREVYTFYKNIVKKWFTENISSSKYKAMLKALTNGEINVFEDLFKEFVINSISYFDVSGKEPEKVYHAFVLGMLISLENQYEVKSNRESGYGRYDVAIIPKDLSKLGIIIEFKKISSFSNESMEESAASAIKQIQEKNYRAELVKIGINEILEIAIVFKGKELIVVTK